jgi:hypothetical protein
MTVPTQAQLEAATKAAEQAYIHCGTDFRVIAEAALTAAAQVGEQYAKERHDAQVDRYILMAHATIERCAQVAESDLPWDGPLGPQIAAAIRKLKDTP